MKERSVGKAAEDYQLNNRAQVSKFKVFVPESKYTEWKRRRGVWMGMWKLRKTTKKNNESNTRQNQYGKRTFLCLERIQAKRLVAHFSFFRIHITSLNNMFACHPYYLTTYIFQVHLVKSDHFLSARANKTERTMWRNSPNMNYFPVFWNRTCAIIKYAQQYGWM